MEIIFYDHRKKVNSTALPIQGTFKNCSIKDVSSLINPYIEIAENLSVAPPWNYCYIPAYNRYYSIIEWTWERGFWSAELSVDVLASYRETIFNSTLYVVRSASNYDGNIIDKIYPTKIDNELIRVPLAQPWSVDVIPTNGTFVIGVTAPSGGYFGSMNYYAMSQSGYAKLCDYLSSQAVTTEEGFNEDDCSLALQKALVDPFQYIKSCKWIPLAYNDTNFKGVHRTSLPIYQWSVDVGACTQLVKCYGSVEFNVDMRRHPQTNDRGMFVNYEPYTNINMFLPPFGTFPLDTTYTGINRSGFQVSMLVDYITGGGAYYVQVLDPESRQCGIIANGYGQVAVDMQLSQVNTSMMGLAFTKAGVGVDELVSGLSLGQMTPTDTIGENPISNVGGIIRNAGMQSIGNAVQARFSKAVTSGTQGGFSSYAHVPYIDYQFFTLVDDDITEEGRPLMKNMRLGNLSGYCICKNGDVSIGGTAQEQNAIKTYLESGVYIE